VLRRSRCSPLRPTLLLLAAALLAAACGGAESGGRSAAGFPVDVAVASQDTLSVEVSAVGTLQAQASAQVASEVDGTVSRIEFEEGARVPAEKLLVQLDAAKLRAALQAAEASAAQAEAQARNLERQVSRNQDLLSQGAISKQAFDDLQSAYRAAAARLDQARANAALARQQLRDASIRAPFAGRVGERTFDVGDYVRKGDPLFSVTDDDTLQVRFTVPEQYVEQLRPGSAMQVRVPSVPGRWFDGEVYFVSPTVDPDNRTVTLKAGVPNPDGRLRAGSSADVRLVLERRSDAVLVPEAAIVPREGKAFIFLVRGDKAVLAPVTVGVRTEGRVEIRAGVSGGDTVVTAGQQRLEDGAPVRIEGRGPGVPTDTGPASDSSGATPAGTGGTGSGGGTDGPGG
jgi:membrane fusion protein (multidrug efflux system)